LRGGNNGAAWVSDDPANAGGVGLSKKQWSHRNRQKNEQKRYMANSQGHNAGQYTIGEIC
jgi:hypothetical protein